ncbi:MAG TPA: hypothetical protein VKD25_06715 [Burkholderiales bacterium]|nr:hypothetical protein [Burkholderiales bacterium]
MNFSDPVIVAALIGASATVLAALVQLRLSWRKEMKERERGQPITKKTRRGPVLFVFVLVIAAAVGGFAFSQYLLSLLEEDRDSLRGELKTRLAEINATAMRLEQARLAERRQIESEIHRADALRQGEEGVTATIVVGPCRAEGAQAADGRRECREQSAARIAVCARVPAAAAVKEVLLYTRLEESQQPWAEARVQAGEDAGQARFVDKPFERPDGEAGKQVCQGFVQWNSEKSRLARILVKYTL